MNYVKAFWYMSNNFGDNLNYHIIKNVSGKEPVLTHDKNENHYIVCGSIITEATINSTIWGAGFANQGESIDPGVNVVAVRGMLSKACIGKEVLTADPALLMPMFYNSKKEKKYKIGIIPHWKDVEKVCLLGKHHIINPLKPVTEVIDDILSCEFIISSSLHGLILADAYGTPNEWIDFGTDIGGDGFKFYDYYSTTNSPKTKPVTNIEDANFTISDYKFNLTEFLNSCPFK